MCDQNNCCQQPEKIKGQPKDCTPKQIKECHGDDKKHPCLSSDEAMRKQQ